MDLEVSKVCRCPLRGMVTHGLPNCCVVMIGLLYKAIPNDCQHIDYRFC